MKTYILAALTSAWLLAPAAHAEPSNHNIAYVSYDGSDFIVFDLTTSQMSYQGSSDPVPGSDLGASFSDCSDAQYLCIDKGQPLAVPRSGDLPDSWEYNGTTFKMLQVLTGSGDKVWLISVTAKGDAYLNFSYSRQRGIETLSEQMDGQPSYLVRTYFLVNQKGLLADPTL